jgi:hypothetical protein
MSFWHLFCALYAFIAGVSQKKVFARGHYRRICENNFETNASNQVFEAYLQTIAAPIKPPST